MRSIQFLVAGAVLAVICSAPGLSKAQVAFTRIADTSTFIPGTSTPFTNFTATSGISPGVPPAVDGSDVAFLGNTRTGVYRWHNGVLSTVADQSTQAPNGSGKFTIFLGPAISGQNVAFHAMSTTEGVGIYSSIAGSLVRIADNSVAPPTGGPNFNLFGEPGIGGTVVSFLGDPPDVTGFAKTGLYQGSSYQTLTVIADTNTPIPGGLGTFESFNTSASSAGSNVAFAGSAVQPVNQRGVYKYVNGVLSRVADQSTPIPDGNVFGFISVAMDGSDVAFLGSNGNGPNFSGSWGIYTEVNGVLRHIVHDEQTRPEGGPFIITTDTNFAFDNGLIAFRDRARIYVSDVNGNLTRLIGPGDNLDGRTVASVNLGRYGFSDGNLAFWARFTDDTSGIYLAQNVPEPFAAAAIALLPFALISRRRPARTSRPESWSL